MPSISVEQEWRKLSEYESLLEGLPELAVYNDLRGYWYVQSRITTGYTDSGRISSDEAQALIKKASEQNLDGFRLSVPNKHGQVVWEKEYAIAYFPWGSETATISTHKDRAKVYLAVEASAWASDSDLPCMGMKGYLITSTGDRYELYGTRDVGIRTGYSPKLSIYRAVMHDYL